MIALWNLKLFRVAFESHQVCQMYSRNRPWDLICTAFFERRISFIPRSSPPKHPYYRLRLVFSSHRKACWFVELQFAPTRSSFPESQSCRFNMEQFWHFAQASIRRIPLPNRSICIHSCQLYRHWDVALWKQSPRGPTTIPKMVWPSYSWSWLHTIHWFHRSSLLAHQWWGSSGRIHLSRPFRRTVRSLGRRDQYLGRTSCCHLGSSHGLICCGKTWRWLSASTCTLRLGLLWWLRSCHPPSGHLSTLCLPLSEFPLVSSSRKGSRFPPTDSDFDKFLIYNRKC